MPETVEENAPPRKGLRVLLLSRFMRKAVGFEGDHAVTVWRGEGSRGGGLPFWLRDPLELLKLWRAEEVDVVICNTFGRAYGRKDGERLAWLRHFGKAFYEHVLVTLVIFLKRQRPIPFAVVEVSDDPTLDPFNARLARHCDVFFKRELPLDPYLALESCRGSFFRLAPNQFRSLPWVRTVVERLRPISLGCAFEEPQMSGEEAARERMVDVFYVGDDHNKPLRAGLRDELRELQGEGIAVNAPEASLSREAYFEAMKGARLAVSPPGLGYDCHRHYEAAFCGAVPVMPYPTIRQSHPFEDGVTCFFYDPEFPLADQLKEMLRDRAKVEEVAAAAKAHVERHHRHADSFARVLEATRDAAGSPA